MCWLQSSASLTILSAAVFIGARKMCALRLRIRLPTKNADTLKFHIHYATCIPDNYYITCPIELNRVFFFVI